MLEAITPFSSMNPGRPSAGGLFVFPEYYISISVYQIIAQPVKNRYENIILEEESQSSEMRGGWRVDFVLRESMEGR